MQVLPRSPSIPLQLNDPDSMAGKKTRSCNLSFCHAQSKAQGACEGGWVSEKSNYAGLWCHYGPGEKGARVKKQRNG
eukprot:3003765-Amphidinium_carterae.1